MSYTPPFVPESRQYDETLQNRVARARKAREDAAARVAKRYAAIKPDRREWRTGTEFEWKPDRPDVL